jgi:hypothetical protein
MEHNQENKIPNTSINVTSTKHWEGQERELGRETVNPMPPFLQVIFHS